MDPKQKVDLEEVTKLVEALEHDLARVREGSSDVQTLRDEVETLRHALNADEPHDEGVRERLHSVKVLLEDVAEEAREEAFTGSQYIAAIGRMLGM